jgi:hypothetical protein
MDKTKKYWLVGANWSGDNLEDAFYRRGYWEMGWKDVDQPAFAKKRDQIMPDDRIAIKSMDGQGASTISIHAIGIVKEVANGKVYIDWKVTDLDRHVPSKGAFSTIHGPYDYSDAWTRETFCL